MHVMTCYRTSLDADNGAKMKLLAQDYDRCKEYVVFSLWTHITISMLDFDQGSGCYILGGFRLGFPNYHLIVLWIAYIY